MNTTVSRIGITVFVLYVAAKGFWKFISSVEKGT